MWMDGEDERRRIGASVLAILMQLVVCGDIGVL